MKLLIWIKRQFNQMVESPEDGYLALRYMLLTKQGRKVTFYRPSVMIVGLMGTLSVSSWMYESTQSIWQAGLIVLVMVLLLSWATDEDTPAPEKE